VTVPALVHDSAINSVLRLIVVVDSLQAALVLCDTMQRCPSA
jgi:hypothetical protein